MGFQPVIPIPFLRPLYRGTGVPPVSPSRPSHHLPRASGGGGSRSETEGASPPQIPPYTIFTHLGFLPFSI